jgi:tryptophan 6-halogenase
MDKTFRVVIVGGGSAGWMTAAYLVKALNHRVDITVIESANIGAIGVGEATFSTIRLFFEFLGLQEEDWMPHCSASYKLAIRFVDWNAQRQPFYHPFQRFEMVDGRSMSEWWLKLKRHTVPMDYACFTVPRICDAKRAPRFMDGRVFDRKVDGYLSPDNTEKAMLLEELKIQYPYAYHFDASLIAKFMARFAQTRGVRQIVDEVVDVPLTESGSIRNLRTSQHGDITGDLFIDCTGFRGLLINEVLKEPFISFAESLPCDRAVALQVPSDPENEGIEPYTTATAMSAGWTWKIPLFHRIGSGYVYSSAFQSPEEAERELRHHLGIRSQGCRANHIKMRIGRNRNSWVRNCVAIGLSSGFVEPLESTGIFFIQHGIEQLACHFPGKTQDLESIESFNRSIADCIDGVREFLTLHYAAATRADTPFWKATKSDIVVPPELAERLRLWRKRLPTNRTINPKYHGFEAYSYAVMLIGLGYVPECSLPIIDYVRDDVALAAFASLQTEADRLVETLPSLYKFLSNVYSPAWQGTVAM